ncbi:transglycosylase SLT domain-containing protein [Bdellovibrio sp. HCB337]|uniref:transglycosylase SLT domain-containing protein n=1 Tax=Bdellovibrio sp. HCB337 TaxID=3394358 RepID=UPI0039A5AE6B
MKNTYHKPILFAGIILSMQLTAGCLEKGDFSTTQMPSTDSETVAEVTPTPTPTPSPTPEITPSPTPKPTPTPAVTPSPTPTPPDKEEEALRDVTPLWEAKTSQGKTWTDHVNRQLDTIGQDMLDVVPADSSLFCPKYSKMSDAQRKHYWTFMISAMTRFESNFNTNSKYTEDFNDSNGNKVISRGLLQISIESANSYGCGFKNAEELHDPLKNLSCGVRILNRWVGQRDFRIAGKVDGKWRGGARYWAVLRAGDKTSYKSILKWSQELSICK